MGALPAFNPFERDEHTLSFFLGIIVSVEFDELEVVLVLRGYGGQQDDLTMPAQLFKVSIATCLPDSSNPASGSSSTTGKVEIPEFVNCQPAHRIER